MKKSITITAMLLLSAFMMGQEVTNPATVKESSFGFGVKINGGTSQVMERFMPSIFNFVPNNMFQFAYNFGILTNYKLYDDQYINLDILYNRENGLDHLNEDYVNGSQQIIGSGIRDIKRQIDYLSIPIYYSVRLCGWRLGAGLQASFPLSSSMTQTYTGIKNELPYYYQVTTTSTGITMPDIGPKLLLFYDITKRIFIDIDYYYGVSPINNHSGYSSQTLTTQEATIGIGFNIIR